MAEQQAPPLTIQEFLEARWSEIVFWVDQSRYGGQRLLADVAAKRAILELHGGDDTACQSYAGNWVWTPCPTLLALASVYRDHPDFNQEWL